MPSCMSKFLITVVWRNRQANQVLNGGHVFLGDYFSHASNLFEYRAYGKGDKNEGVETVVHGCRDNVRPIGSLWNIT